MISAPRWRSIPAPATRNSSPGPTRGWSPLSWTTSVPLLVLTGEADTWTPFAPCAAFIDAARARGNPVEIKSYPDVFHSFDAPNLPRRELPAYRTDAGSVPVIATDKDARADALVRVPAFLQTAPVQAN